MFPRVSLRNPAAVWSNKPLVLALLLLTVIAIVFWTGSRYPSLNRKAMTGADTQIQAIGFDTIVEVNESQSIPRQMAGNSLNWMWTNKQGMTFGVLFAATLMTVLSLVDTTGSKNPLLDSALGVAIGAPLGVCVNCAAPIAEGLHRAGVRAVTALSTMMSSPTLNVIVLAIGFALFPPYIVGLKITLTLIFVVFFIPLLARVLNVPESIQLTAEQTDTVNRNPFALAGAAVKPPEAKSLRSWPHALLWVGEAFLRNLWYIVKKTVPLMILAGVLGSVLITVLPFGSIVSLIPPELSPFHVAFYAAVIAAIGLFLPVPMAFDVIVVAVLFDAGLPMKYAAVLLMTLGIYSIYPFFIVWTSISRRMAVGIFVVLIGFGVVAGWAGDELLQRDLVRQETLFFSAFSDEADGVGPTLDVADHAGGGVPAADLLAALAPAAVVSDPVAAEAPAGISLSAMPFAAATTGDLPFTRYQGIEYGFDEPYNFSERKLLLPFSVMRGITSGDVHNDGWVDVVVTSEMAIALYANRGGERFERQQIDIPLLAEIVPGAVALVDINNDGWLDLHFTTFRNGNYVLYNTEGRFESGGLTALPGHPEAFLTVAPAFADVDYDGDLDIFDGNWTGGPYNRFAPKGAKNALLVNNDLTFAVQELGGTPGQTLATIFTDFNNDGFVDLLVGNDFRPADVFYLGDADGNFTTVRKDDGLIPYSTGSTMSFATDDINNDLIPETYIGQVARGTEARKMSPAELCAEITDDTTRQTCVDSFEIRDIMIDAKEGRDPATCLELDDLDYRQACFATAMVAFATRLNRDEQFCDLLPDNWAIDDWAFICNMGFYEVYEMTEEEAAQAIDQERSYNVLLVQGADGIFTDEAEAFDLEVGGWTWNAKFADVDNDEWLDIYIANGYISGDVVDNEQESNYFYHNAGGGHFERATEAFGLESLLDYSAYTYADIDNDGDLDIIAVPLVGPISTFINHAHKNAIAFELRDEVGNRFGINSRVIIHYGPNGERHQMREIRASGGFISYDAPMAYFGLSDYDAITRVEVHWSTGEISVIEGPLAAGARYTITRSP